MRHAPIALAIAILLLSSSALGAAPPRRARPAKPPTPPPTLDVPAGTRLLVIAPHPDDEVLGAGGLMQRVKSTGGTVRIVYLTDGDGYPEGVRDEDHIATPTAKNYLGYGKQRRREARAALVRLGLADAFQTFLGFPDGGLCQLTRAYWSDRRGAYRSPYTRMTRPLRSELLVPSTRYRGEDLSQELALVIGDFKPTMIAVPARISTPITARPGSFADSLTDVRRVHLSSRPTPSTTSSTSTPGRSRTMGRGSIRRSRAARVRLDAPALTPARRAPSGRRCGGSPRTSSA
jgi:hypothetical protein